MRRRSLLQVDGRWFGPYESNDEAATAGRQYLSLDSHKRHKTEPGSITVHPLAAEGEGEPLALLFPSESWGCSYYSPDLLLPKEVLNLHKRTFLDLLGKDTLFLIAIFLRQANKSLPKPPRHAHPMLRYSCELSPRESEEVYRFLLMMDGNNEEVEKLANAVADEALKGAVPNAAVAPAPPKEPPVINVEPPRLVFGGLFGAPLAMEPWHAAARAAFPGSDAIPDDALLSILEGISRRNFGAL